MEDDTHIQINLRNASKVGFLDTFKHHGGREDGMLLNQDLACTVDQLLQEFSVARTRTRFFYRQTIYRCQGDAGVELDIVPICMIAFEWAY